VVGGGEAVEAAARRLGLEVGREVFEGGSAARVFMARRPDGTRVALKVLVEAPGTVDGHDLGSFHQKVVQIDKIREGAPVLGARYLPVLDTVDGQGWAASTTPWYLSEDTAAPLRGDGGGDLFFARLDHLVDVVFLRGYGVDAAPAPAGCLASMHIARFLRRFALLAGALDPDVVVADAVVVNGRHCRSPRQLVERLLADPPPALAQMEPPRLMFPAHGDANTRNVLFIRGGTDFRVIDPRGSTGYWDPVYDLAKTVFSLSVWDPALRLGFVIDREAGARLPTFDVGFRAPTWAGYRGAVHRFGPWLAGHAGIGELLDGDAAWWERLLLTHDLHVLAEAPCRLSDRKPKWDARGEVSTPEALALGHYLMGTLLLNDLVDQLDAGGDLDADRHFDLVTSDLPTG
jgi:hypothetical protein